MAAPRPESIPDLSRISVYSNKSDYFRQGTIKYRLHNGKHLIYFDDGGAAVLDMSEHLMRYIKNETVREQPPPIPKRDLELVGKRLEVYWPDDDAFYPGCVARACPSGWFVVTYDDGDVEVLRLRRENVRWIAEKQAKRRSSRRCVISPSSL